MLKKLKPYIESGVSNAVRVLPRIHPNVITVIGLVPPVLFYYFLSHGQLGWAIVSYCGTLVDLLDGIYARATNQTSHFGAFLDSTLDRLADAVFIAAFGAAGIISWPIVIIAIIVSFLISYTRSRGELLLPAGITVSVGPIERAERLGIIFLALISFVLIPEIKIGIYPLHEILFFVLIVLSAVTISNRLRFVYNNIK